MIKLGMTMAARGSSEIQTFLEEAVEACRRKQPQLTQLRRAVFDLMRVSDRLQTAYQLLDRLKEWRPGAAPPTVYRALDVLVEHHMVHKLERLNAYLACTIAAPRLHRALFLLCNAFGLAEEAASEPSARIAAATVAQRRSQDAQARRHSRYEEAARLQSDGISISGIAEALGVERKTRRRWLGAGRAPLWKMPPREGISKSHLDYRDSRWVAGPPAATMYRVYGRS